MKNRQWILLAMMATLTLLVSVGLRVDDVKPDAKTYNDLRVGVMHPWEASEGEATCPLCGMALQVVHGHKPGTLKPPLDSLFIDPDNAMWVHEGMGKSPSGKDLIPITKSSYYDAGKRPQGEAMNGMSGKPMSAGSMSDDSKSSAKSMAGMDMSQKASESGAAKGSVNSRNDAVSKGQRKVKYWVAPMDPTYISDEPGKSPMGMDLVPVYEDEGGSKPGVVSIDPVTLQNIGVVSEVVGRRDLSQEIRTNGTVKVAENREYTVTARVKGYVEKLYVARTGDPVRKGQPLLAIYSPELVTAQEELLLALRNYESLKGSGIGNLETNSFNLLQAAEQRLSLWDITDEQIKEIEDSRRVQRRLTLVSPADGVVLKKNVVEGDAVGVGAKLFSIGNLDHIWVTAQVYEYELPWVREGDKTRITSSYDPTYFYDGTVEYIYPTLDPRSRTAEVRISLPNPGEDLKPDMWVDVEILANPRKQVVAVPKSAVIRSGKRDIVFVDEGGGRYIPHEVHLSVETGSYYEILAGVNPGQKVATSAEFLLDSEAKLQEAIQRRIDKKMAAGKADANTGKTSGM